MGLSVLGESPCVVEYWTIITLFLDFSGDGNNVYVIISYNMWYFYVTFMTIKIYKAT